jgi:hypothetical protein
MYSSGGVAAGEAGAAGVGFVTSGKVRAFARTVALGIGLLLDVVNGAYSSCHPTIFLLEVISCGVKRKF